jgi:EmrB/QacA subfamily drug resistance transporter
MKSNSGILLLLFFGVFLGALDIAVIGPVLPELKKIYALNDLQVSWIFNAYVLTNLISTPLMASLSDKKGRRIIYIICLLLFGAGSALIAISESPEMLLSGRVLQGFGAGGIFPLASAIIGDVFPPEKQGRALGITGSVFGLAFLAGPPLGAWLLLYNWRWIFLLNVPLVLCMLIPAWKLLPKASDNNSTVHMKPILLLGLALLCTAYGMSHLQHNLWQASALLPGIVFFRLWYIDNNRRDEPMLDPALLKNKQVRKVMLLAWGAGLGEVAVVFLPALAVERFGVDAASGGFMLIPLVLALAVGAPLAGRLLDRIGSAPVLFAGLILLALGLLGIGLNRDFSIISYYGNTILIGLGLSALLGAPLRYILNQITGKHNRASGQSIISVSMSTGQLMASSLAVPLARQSGNYGLLLIVLAGITLLLMTQVQMSNKSNSIQA